MRLPLLIGLSFAVAVSPATAQVRPAPTASSVTEGQEEEQNLPQQPRQTPLDTNQAGRTAQSAAGQVGQRQTRDTAATQTGIKPMARVASRIQNRVQNRIRNRIDRNYDPQANATSPFATAAEQIGTEARPRR